MLINNCSTNLIIGISIVYRTITVYFSPNYIVFFTDIEIELGAAYSPTMNTCVVVPILCRYITTYC